MKKSLLSKLTSKRLKAVLIIGGFILSLVIIVRIIIPALMTPKLCIPLNEDRGHSVVQTNDGGYLIVGFTKSMYAWLIKTDEEGNVQWDRPITWASSRLEKVIKDNENYVAIGSIANETCGTWNILCIKVNENGNIEWNKTYGGNSTDQGFSITQVPDGGYVIVGRTKSYGSGNFDVWLIKVDENGDMEWNKTYGGVDIDQGFSITKAPNGGYVIVGDTASYGSGYFDVWLIKVDEDGNVEWNKTYGEREGEVGFSVIQASDGGYITVGCTAQGSNGDAWLIKIDEDGNVEWNKTYGSNSYDDCSLCFCGNAFLFAVIRFATYSFVTKPTEFLHFIHFNQFYIIL